VYNAVYNIAIYDVIYDAINGSQNPKIPVTINRIYKCTRNNVELPVRAVSNPAHYTRIRVALSRSRVNKRLNGSDETSNDSTEKENSVNFVMARHGQALDLL